MKNKLFVWLFLLMVLLTGVFATDFVCCYEKTRIDAVESGLCSTENTMGAANLDNPNMCNFARLNCKTSSGQCTSSPNGNFVYDSVIVKNKFSSICSSFHSITDTSCNVGLSVVSSNVSNSSISDGGVISSGNLNPNQINSNIDISMGNIANLQVNALQKVCSDAGGQFGFFVNKFSCEAISGCMYNPIYGGFLTNNFADLNLKFNYDFFEKNSCVSKALVQKCSDYKVKSNCEQNIALNYSKSFQGIDISNLENGCFWINSNQYSNTDTFSNQNGVCISNLTLENKYYDRKVFTDRQNLIKNPSFENSVNGWQGSNNNKIRDYSFLQTSCYNGNYCYDLGGNNISQKIYGFSNGATLSSFLYIQRKNFGTENIEAKVTFYNSKNVIIKTQILSHTLLNNFSFSLGGFEKLGFESFRVPNGTSYIEFKLTGSGSNLIIDAISLQVQPLTPTSMDNEFKTVEIIKSSASYCNLCYDSLDLNSCTAAKSNLLGDCSYMVEDVSTKYVSSLATYSGKDENIFSKNMSWKSQSLANSFLFCEMYTRRTECLNPNNYINSKYSSIHIGVKSSSHPSLLCQWDTEIGCYKDSNGDNKLDTVNGMRKSFSNEVNFNQLEATNTYKYVSDASGPSDFALGCDVVPPTGYIYFKGKNQTQNDKYIFSQNFVEPLGNVKIVYDAFDYPIDNTDSCNGNKFENHLIFDYKIGNSLNNMYPGENGGINHRFFSEMDIKEFFKNSSGTMLSDGDNYINLQIKDRSGNVGFNKSYHFNIDTNGPIFNMAFNDEEISKGEWLSTVLGKNMSFNFSISDYSKVAWCNYTLSPVTNLNPNYYTPYGSFNLSNIFGTNADINSNFRYNFRIPINNTPVTMTSFKLNVTCADIFDQRTTNYYYFRVDFDTNLILISPPSYTNYSSRNGFSNNTFEMNLISSDKYISDCKLNVGGVVHDFDLVNLPFGLNNYGFNISLTPFNYSGYSEKFYVNITVPVTLQNLGLNHISFTCTDVVGNIHTEQMSYYFDNVIPSYLSYNLINTNVSNRKSVFYNDGKYYVTDLGNVSINLSLDGTSSCISNFSSLRGYNGSQIANNNNAVNFPFSLKSKLGVNLDTNVIAANKLSRKENIEKTCNSTTFISEMILTNFNNPLVYAGIKNKSNYDLAVLKYGFDFNDFAGNKNSVNILEFYYDSNIPTFNLVGNDILVNDGSLYTNKINPEISVDFMTADYRNYSCKVTIKWDKTNGNVYLKSSFDYFVSNKKDLKFNLQDITSSINLSRYPSTLLTFDCIDNYGALPSKSFVLNYDNAMPVMNDFSFTKQNIYLVNYNNPIYNDINNSLIFNLANTGEVGYICYYTFSSNDYDCKNEIYNFSFKNTLQLVPVVLIGSNDMNRQNSNAICIRKSNFNNVLESSSNQKLTTLISARGQCFDMINQQTIEKNTLVNISYLTSEMISFDINYSNGKAYPRVNVFNPYDKIVLSYDNLGEQSIAELTNGAYNQLEGIYTYTLSSGIDLSSFDEGSVSIYAVGFSEDSAVNSIHTNLIVDKTAPSLEFNISDVNSGNIYSSNFVMNFNTYDLRGIKKIELYQNTGSAIFIYNLSDGSFFYNSSFIGGDFENWNSCSTNYCFGLINYVNGIIGTNYILTMKVYDIFGNVNLSTINIRVADGVSVTLLDSVNSKVSPSGIEWLTTLDSPIISFKTTRDAEFCKVFPMMDNEWQFITSNLDVNLTSSEIMNTRQIYDLDLSSINSFNLSKKSDLSSNVKINCNYNGSTYSYIRKVKKITYLPDYVLNSSEGFVLNENPYTTVLDVKSVGPYRYLDYCNYSINGIDNSFMQRGKTKFNKEVDFSNYLVGSYDLALVCRDVVGNIGPTKHYIFNIGKNVPLEISNLKLVKGDKEFDFERIINTNIFYVSDKGPYTIKFNTNKKNGIICSYSLSPSDLAVSRFLTFVKNLFGFGYERFVNTNSVYTFEKNEVTLQEDVADLRIECNLGSEKFTNYYVIKVDNSKINSTILLN